MLEPNINQTCVESKTDNNSTNLQSNIDNKKNDDSCNTNKMSLRFNQLRESSGRDTSCNDDQSNEPAAFVPFSGVGHKLGSN